MSKYYCLWCRKFHHRGKLFFEHIKYEYKTEEKIQDEIYWNKRQQDYINENIEEINGFPEHLKKYMLEPRHKFTMEEAREVNWFKWKIQQEEIIRFIELTHKRIQDIITYYMRRSIREYPEYHFNNKTQTIIV